MKKYIRFDWAVKRILRNKADFGILEGFLSELIGEDVTIQKVLEGESNQVSADDKYNRVDVLVENSNGELIIIEIQNNNELDYFHRMLYGSSKLVTEYINLGEPYSTVKKIISINIVYFDLGQGNDYVYKGTTQFKGLHKNDILELSDKQKELFEKEKVDSIFPEYYIIKVNQFDDLARDSLDQWIYFLKNEEIEDDFTAKGLPEAKEKLAVMKLSESERKQYQLFLENLSYKAGMARTIKEEEKDEIKKESYLEVARKMIKMGFYNDQIIKATGLSESEIIKLREQK